MRPTSSTRTSTLFPYNTLYRAFQHAARQAYISFGIAIAAAAELKVDATPMEGFDNAALDKLLGLNERGLKSVTLLPLGYRDESNDWLVNLKKVRKPRDRKSNTSALQTQLRISSADLFLTK